MPSSPYDQNQSGYSLRGENVFDVTQMTTCHQWREHVMCHGARTRRGGARCCVVKS